MTKLSRKFILGITVILIFSTLCTICLNAGFIEKYYLHQKRTSLNSISQKLASNINDGMSIDDAVSQTENSNKVIIAKIDNSNALDNNTVNDTIRNAFQEKGIGFQKYWLWEEDFKQILAGDNKIRLYKQDKLNYSLLIEYSYIASQLFAVTMIVPNIADAFGIINAVLIFINILALIIAIFFIFILIKRITRPLKKFEAFARSMENSEFIPLDIHTNDELEQVANHLNTMGGEIISYQDSLQKKNEQMEQLLDDVAHDLKTPVSLIKLYTEGIGDGLDDGTFLSTISEQSRQMDQLINKLLFFTRIEKETAFLEECNLSLMLLDLLKEYSALAAGQNLEFSMQIEENIIIHTQADWIKTILSNLITNAVKYSSSIQIKVALQSSNDNIIFTISNECRNESLDIRQIWNPYYVGEKSRNKHLSGSGLGLSIVKRLAEKLKYDISCTYTLSRSKTACPPDKACITGCSKECKNYIISFTLTIPAAYYD